MNEFNTIANPNRLRYEIHDWSEINECLSNNSRDLRARCVEVCDEDLRGRILLVEHAVYGTLFACMVEGEGSILSAPDPFDPCTMHYLREEEIMMELYKYGFDIRIRRERKLTGEQLDYLMNLNNLGFDKIRNITIVLPYAPHKPKYKQVVVGFMVGALPDWLNNTYQCPESEFLKAIEDGSAVNLTAISRSRHFDWFFLRDHVLSINDILAVNS